MLIEGRIAGADVVITENRGRDIGPFLWLLESGRLDRYTVVCKLHGKRSKDGPRHQFSGDYWRRRMFCDLLGHPPTLDAIVARFKAETALGLLGPANYRYPNEIFGLEPSWGQNRATVLALAEKMGRRREDFTLDFFAGTMFWVRPAALLSLRGLGLYDQLQPEQGLLDGALEHAIERLFTTSAVLDGYSIASISS